MYLSDLLQNLYSDLGQTDPNFGNFVATGGSATTFVNTDWGNLESPPEEDTLKNRFAFIVNTTDGLSPQGKWARVTAYVSDTYTATIATVTDAIGAGDVIMLPKQDLFPLQEVVSRVNRALTNLGNIALVDTSLTATGGTTEYAVPLALKQKPPIAIWIDDSVLNDGWDPVTEWRFEPAAPGTTGKLFMDDLPAGKAIKIVYNGIHPYVSAYNSVISETIHPKVATLASMVEVLTWYNNRDENQGANEYYVWLLQQAKSDLAMAKAEHPIWKPTKAAKWFSDKPVFEKTKDMTQ